MIDKNYVKSNQEKLVLEYVDILLSRVNVGVIKHNSDKQYSLIDEFVFKKSMIVDISFACELLIKALLLRQGYSFDQFKSHDLSISFGLLDINIQNRIKSNMDENDFDNKISNENNRLAYEKSRYIFEDSTGNTDYVFISNLCKALYEEVNNKSLDMLLIESNISENDYNSIDKKSNKALLINKTMKILDSKDSYMLQSKFDEEEEYLHKNIKSCDLALFCELLLKKYSDQNIRTHEYSDLYKKLENAIQFMFAKGIYSDFETNKDCKYTLFYSEESFFYPDNFTKLYSAERNGILKKLGDIFLKSRYCCFEYFDKYDEILKFYLVSKGIDMFTDGNEDTVNKLHKFRSLVDCGGWYGFSIPEILSLDMDYVKQLDELFIRKKYLKSVLIYRNLLKVKKENQNKVLKLLEDRFDDYESLLDEINDDTIDYFIGDAQYIDTINNYFQYNMNPIKGKLPKIGIPYVYSLVTDEVIKSCPGLIINIINGGKQYDLYKVVRLVQIIINNKSLRDNEKLLIINNMTSILDCPDEKIGYAVAMLSLALSPLRGKNVISIENKEFLNRPMEEVRTLVEYYRRYSKELDDNDYFYYLSKADPKMLYYFEELGIFKYYNKQLDISLFVDNNIIIKYLDYIFSYPYIDVSLLDILKSDLSVDEINHLVNSPDCLQMIYRGNDSYESLSSFLKNKEVLSSVFEAYPEFLTYDIIKYIPNHYLANNCMLLKRVMATSNYFINFRNYNSHNQRVIISYFGRLFKNYTREIIDSDFDRFMIIDTMPLYEEHPELLSRFEPKDYMYYTVTSVNTLYEKIKSGVFSCNGSIVTIDDTTNLVRIFLENVNFDVNDITRISDLLTSKIIINNMSDSIMRFGTKEILEEKGKDFKSNSLVQTYNVKDAGNIYDTIAVIYSNDRSVADEEYNYIKEYLDFLNTNYVNDKGIRGILLDHISIVLACYNSYLPYDFYRVLKESKKYIESNPSKLQSVINDINMYLLDQDIDVFVNKDLAEIIRGPIEEPYIENTPPIEDVYEVLDEKCETSIIDKAKIRLDIMKTAVTNKYALLKFYLIRAADNIHLLDRYNEAKDFFVRVSLANERKFKRVEKEINYLVEKELQYDRRK